MSFVNRRFLNVILSVTRMTVFINRDGKMWFRKAKLHGSYLVGVVTTMLFVLYLHTTLRMLQQEDELVSTESKVTAKHTTEDTTTEDQSEFARYIVSLPI